MPIEPDAAWQWCTDLSHCELCDEGPGLPMENPVYIWPENGRLEALYQCTMHPWVHWSVTYSADYPEAYEAGEL